MKIPNQALIHLDAMLDIIKPSVPVTGAHPACLECKEPLEFSEDAIENITFKAACKVTQTVFSCQACYCRMVIFSKGGVPTEATEEGDLFLGPPTMGFHIARV